MVGARACCRGLGQWLRRWWGARGVVGPAGREASASLCNRRHEVSDKAGENLDLSGNRL